MNASLPAPAVCRIDEPRLREVLLAAVSTVAPQWSLREFVAVNPFVGFDDRPFPEAARFLRDVGGVRLTMPRSFYVDAVADGRIAPQDLEAAAANAPSSLGVEDGAALLRRARGVASVPVRGGETVAELAAGLTTTNWSEVVADRIGVFAEAHYALDEGGWGSPWRHLPAFEAWKREAELDRAPELLGAVGFRRQIRTMPDDALTSARVALERLDLSTLHFDGLHRYFCRLLGSIRGWAAHARARDWHRPGEGTLGHVAQLLCIRLAWDAALLTVLDAGELRAAWTSTRRELEAPIPRDRELEIDLALHEAFENGTRRRLFSKLAATPSMPAPSRPRAQAAFCIDVRSETLRHALERVAPWCTTYGVAGFFGLPIELVAPGQPRGLAHCPALIQPSCKLEDRDHRPTSRWQTALEALKSSGVSSFGFVETLGIGYAARLVADSLGWGATKPHVPRAAHQDLPLAQRVDLAAGLLQSMSASRPLARIVLLCGHTSTTTNNPYAASLECGACAGHGGAPNARLAATLLNDPQVRVALAGRGVVIENDTVFVAGVHETVTNRVEILDATEVPTSHAADLAQLREALSSAGALVRTRTAGAVADPATTTRQADARTRDWSEVRPEWGLAGCSSFIIAPRHRTRGLDLDGRAFLHSYDWKHDVDFATLEALMTAPLVVGSWINLQYFGSTVDPDRLGAGDKRLHNVVGAIGVVEGNRGDLRVGLPLQSLHDGVAPVHEPVRLTAIVEAPTEAIGSIIQRRPEVRRLLDHGWLHLFAVDSQGAIAHRYAGGGRWERVSSLDDRAGADPRLAS